MDGSKRPTSSVSPLCDSINTRSSGWMRPKSPWTASAGCKKWLRAGGCQGGGNFLADQPCLAHAADNHVSAAVEQQLDGPEELRHRAVWPLEPGLGFR